MKGPAAQRLTPEELWAKNDAQDGGRAAWYGKAVAYWDRQEASYDGVLGGYGSVSAVDVRDSSALLLKAFRKHFEARNPAEMRAIDLGAGVGRVTEQLLLRHFGTVDVLEPSTHLLEKARASLPPARPLPGAPPGHAAGDFLQQGLETWAPPAGRYDCVWAQWCLLYLTDDDLVAFLRRAAAGLAPGGLIVVKENVCAAGFVVDRDDNSLTRSAAYLLGLAARAELAVVYNVKQRGMPAELFEVRMLVLAPRAPGGAGGGA